MTSSCGCETDNPITSTQSETTTSQASDFMLQHPLYDYFNSSAMSEEEINLWKQGEQCYNFSPRTNITEPLGLIYCPMPFESSSHRACCGRPRAQYCCTQQHDTLANKWGIAVGVVLACFTISIIVVLIFNRCSAFFTRRSPTAPPRPKVKINGRQTNVGPSEKRIILKTAYYTVEVNWEELHIKFNNSEYFTKVLDGSRSRYHDNQWEESVGGRYHGSSGKEVMCDVITSQGSKVTLRFLCDSETVIVSDVGRSVWVMNDYQNICKNITITEHTDLQIEELKVNPRPLTPRLPTIGEEFYELGDHRVKITQTEIEIKFSIITRFNDLKRVLLNKYPTMPWSKSLQRDIAQLELPSGKTVNVHLWEEISTIWLSGDGKREYYVGEFQELYSESLNAPLPEVRCTSTGAPSSLPSGATSPNYKTYPVMYTVKTLKTGGYEIDFGTTDFLVHLRSWFDSMHPLLKWDEYSSRHITRFTLNSNNAVAIHISAPGTFESKLWVYDEPDSSGCEEWKDDYFPQIYGALYDNVFGRRSGTPGSHIDRDSVAPVETSI